MSALPRAQCPDCLKMVAIRRNGELREHYVYLPQREQDASKPLGRVRVCDYRGRGQPA